MTEHLPTLIAVLASLAGVAGSGYWFRRWIQDLKDQLKDLTKLVDAQGKEIDELKTKLRVAAAKRQVRAGRFKQLHASVESMCERIGQLQGSSDKVWAFLFRKFNGELKRLSDEGSNR